MDVLATQVFLGCVAVALIAVLLTMLWTIYAWMLDVAVRLSSASRQQARKSKDTMLEASPDLTVYAPKYIIWGRIDVKGSLGPWEIVWAGDDRDYIEHNARRDFPAEKFDLVTLENGQRP